MTRKWMKRMGCLLGGVAAIWMARAAEDPNLIGFWDFKGGAVGTTVGVVESSVGTQTWTGSASVVGTDGVLPVYTNNVPGGVLYAKIDGCRTVVCENPQSLYFHKATAAGSGSVLDIAGISEDLSARKTFTVEYFVQLNAVNWFASLQYASAQDGVRISLPENNSPGKVCFYQLATSSLGGNPVSSTNISFTGATSLKDGLWHHVAVVYTCGKDEDGNWNADGSGSLACYFDYALKGTMPFTNAAWSAEAVTAQPNTYPYPLAIGCALGSKRFGNYALHGSISGLRISSDALAPDAFLQASVARENTTVGFWPFTDGAPGTDATSISNNLGTLALAAGQGSALKSLAEGVLPQFDADAPGRYVYDSTNAIRRVVENPQSLRFWYNEDVVAESYLNVGGGMVAFPGLGTVISSLGDYTIELFFKNEDTSQWQWANFLFGFQDGTGMNEMALSSVKDGKTSWSATYFVDEAAVATYQRPTSWRDGNWHHLALVHSEEDGTSTLYIDYAKQTTSQGTHQNASRTGVDFVLGTRYLSAKRTNYTFHGKVSCLRVTSAALPPENFLQATARKRGGGLSLIIR